MPEKGGTTTQSGISYQNLYAALRIAEMLSGQDLPATSKITGVRVKVMSKNNQNVLQNCFWRKCRLM